MPRTEVSGVVDAEAPDLHLNEGIAVAVYAGRRRWDEFPPEDLQEKKETPETVQSRPVSVRTLQSVADPEGRGVRPMGHLQRPL